MKTIVAQIITLVLIYVPVMLMLAGLYYYVKVRWEKYKMDITNYEDQYRIIEFMIHEMKVTDSCKRCIEKSIEMLSNLPHKNIEKTDVLYGKFIYKFKRGDEAQAILDEISQKTGISVAQMVEQGKGNRNITDSRKMAFRRLREYGFNNQEIADILHRKERSTVTHGLKQAFSVPDLLNQYRSYYPETI